MIMSVEEFKTYVTTEIADSVLEAKLQALELLIRKHTNNNFQNRRIRSVCEAFGGNSLIGISSYFKEGDTVQISECLNEGLYVIQSIDGATATLDGSLFDEKDITVTKIEYPMDVKMGVVNMMKWELENRDKVGIQSETISRHSVTYFNMDGDNSSIGYPKSLIGFLKPYMKARF